GEQPAAPTVLCYQTATWNPDTCLYDVTGEQPAAPTVLCYQTATWNPTTCEYDVTGEQPAAPTVLCYQTATWNPTTCLYDVTGEQPVAPTVLCYQTATWNPTTCLYDVTGEQPAAPTVLCYQTATWNPITCLYDVTGEQPAAPTVLCYQTATWNPDTCLYDVTGEQPAAPTVLCYQTATWNPDTCLYDVTGEQPAAPTVLCYQIATWNPDTCLYDVTGEEPIYQQVTTESCNEAEFDTINLETLLPVGTPLGGAWTNVDNVAGLNGTIFNGYLIDAGNYTFSYIYDGDGPCPERVDVIVNVITGCGVSPCENIIIHNAFTPNGDSLNQYFSIENIEDFACYPTNKVEIYNRWGVLVYETTNYDNSTRRFEGISEGRVTVSKSSELPTGTYFYIIQYTTTEGTTVNNNGYLYLTR
ncbi:gliding motility-associated C-terminal domain-containing protein, partial [Flavobacterium sp.]